MLKKYYTFINESKASEVNKRCRDFCLEDYEISDDGVVTSHSDVYLFEYGLEKLPMKFDRVEGDFDCNNNKLTTLEGSPKEVHGLFDCSDNKLSLLDGAPSRVNGNFFCSSNNLVSLENGPKFVGGSVYDCNDNNIKSFKGFPTNHRSGIDVYFKGSPVDEIYEFFKTPKAITHMNEWEVIDTTDMTISYARFVEVFNEIGQNVPPKEYFTFKHYTLID